MDERFQAKSEETSEGVKARKYRTMGRKQLRIFDVLHATRKHIFLIAICAVLGLILGIALSVVSYLRGEMSRQYAISTSIAVTAQTSSGLFATQGKEPGSGDVYLAQDLVDSVIYVLKSDRTISSAVERLQLMGVTNRDISSNLHLSQYKTTQIIEITLYWRSAEEGVEILQAINEVSPKILLETLRIGNVSVINAPTSRYLIGGSINASMWVYMSALGIMLGVGFSVLELLLRPTLLSTQDMEQTFGVEVLGEIPERRAYFRKKRNLLLTSEDDEKNTEVVDNYIYLAHILKNRLRDWEHPIVYVTSSAQNEGKTTVIAHVAVHLAELGLKTLIIDFDTRNPKLGGLFLQRVEYDNSINALYHGDAEKETCITSLTGQLDILPAVLERRPLPYDDALLDLVRDLKQDYDVVLMDTAPVGQVADTMSLNMLADVALLVVRFDSSSMESIRESLLRLDKSGMSVLGCVVNGVKELTTNNNNSKNYGAHGSSRKPYRRREKSEEEKEWERWERERSNEGPEEEGGKALEDQQQQASAPAEQDPVLAELDQTFQQMVRQESRPEGSANPSDGEKPPRKKPSAGPKARDRRAEKAEARRQAEERRRAAEQRKAEERREAERRRKEAAENSRREKEARRKNRKKENRRTEAYGDMQNLLDILNTSRPGEDRQERK